MHLVGACGRPTVLQGGRQVSAAAGRALPAHSWAALVKPDPGLLSSRRSYREWRGQAGEPGRGRSCGMCSSCLPADVFKASDISPHPPIYPPGPSAGQPGRLQGQIRCAVLVPQGLHVRLAVQRGGDCGSGVCICVWFPGPRRLHVRRGSERQRFMAAFWGLHASRHAARCRSTAAARNAALCLSVWRSSPGGQTAARFFLP